MSSPRYQLLILDWDERILVPLQQILEDAGFDTTITWDETEARRLVARIPYDLVLVGDHPPELKADTVLRGFAQQGSLPPPPSLILGTKAPESSPSHLREIGVIGVIPKQEPFRVLEYVRRHLTLPTARTRLLAAS